MSQYQGQTLEQWAGASKILALVFTDIIDSTSLARRLGDGQWVEVMRRHIAQGRVLITKHKGREVKIIGDAFMVAFHSAVDALSFAIEFRNFPGDFQIKIRAGIHVGPVRIFENDLIGVMVNYTKRVESAGGNLGGIILSNEAKTHIDNERDPRHAFLSFYPLTQSFRGFNEIQTLWRTP